MHVPFSRSLRKTLPVHGIAVPLLWCMASCEKTELVPAYVQLDPVVVSTVPATQGSGTHKITDLWVTADGQDAGVWEAGSKLPVLGSGSTEIRLVAGIPRNGIVDDRIQYPFYQTFQTTVSLEPEHTLEITPTFTYFSGLQFFIDRLEPGGFLVEVDAQSDTTLQLVTDPMEEMPDGIGCARVDLDTDHNLLRFSNFETLDLFSGPVFLELDYKCDHRFLVGVYYTVSGSVVQTPYLYVSPTKRADGGMPWNKIYVDLSPVLTVPGTTDKKFYIECYLEPGETGALFFFDNVKLVHT